MKLNLGAGAVPLDGYENLDRKTGQEVYPLPYEDASVDEIRASHILEHFSHRSTLLVLAEWVRVLKPGGVLKIAVPDFAWIAEHYLNGEDHPFMGYLYGGHVDENDRHGAIFDAEELSWMMGKVGLVDIAPWVTDAPDCSSLPVSLNLQGVKARSEQLDEMAAQVDPAHEEEQQPAPEPMTVSVEQVRKDIKAVLSSNRLMFADTVVSVFSALVPLGVELEINTGVFWGQALTSMLEKHVDDGTKYLLTLDFDTLFTQADVLQLYRLMETYPEIDALCTVQMRREGNTPLMTIASRAGTNIQTIDSRKMDAEVMRINSAHFGLTMIRAESLNKAKKPWFHHQPDERGEWGPEHMDEDVYFWHNWKHSGLTLYQANRVAIGHLQLVGTWPTRSLTPTFQYLKDWYKHGKPAEAMT